MIYVIRLWNFLSDMNKQKMKSTLPFLLGVLAVLCTGIFYLVLGEDAYVTYHDQLDGEMIAYILQARHLFGGNTIPEFMGGMERTALTLPAPMCVLLFCTGHYFAAYVCMHLIGSLTGYLGMYLLSVRMTGCKWIGVLIGVMFAYLPFRPVYGLSQYGIPLLFWCFYMIWQRRRVIVAALYIAIYALNSSLVLVGFAVLGLLFVVIVMSTVFSQKSGDHGRKYDRSIRLGLVWCGMVAIYVLENISLFRQFLGDGDNVSHKVEYALTTEPFWQGWLNAFLYGGSHTEDYHRFLLIAVLLVLIMWLLKRKHISQELNKLGWMMVLLLGVNVFIAFVAALWNCEWAAAVYSDISFLRGFQVERVLWLCSTPWYLLMACVLKFTVEMMKKKRYYAVMSLVVAACIGITGLTILKESDVKVNIRILLNPDYKAISYRDYYAVDVMEQVKEYLRINTGQNPEEYRVVSLGIDPAAAYYSGFYCLDGYSNNYSLDYKHAFQRILEPEFEENDYLRAYFEDWGNRCYLVSSESPGYYTFEKYTSYFWNYKLDADALAGMGGKYLLSAVYILEEELEGLRLMREEAFETPESYYAIYLYEVVPAEKKGIEG